MSCELLVSGQKILWDVTQSQANRGSWNTKPSSDQNEDTAKHTIKSTSSFYYYLPHKKIPRTGRNKTDLV